MGKAFDCVVTPSHTLVSGKMHMLNLFFLDRLLSIRRNEALRKANITHVVSALRQPLDDQLFARYEHHVVEVDDLDEEDIIQHFAKSNAFIKEGLDSGGGVLVHW